MRKKSLSGLSLRLISKRYGEKDKKNPAKSAPISIEKPKWKKSAARIRHQPIENNNKNS